MQIYRKAILTFLLLFCSIIIFAQETDDPATNYKTALALNNAGKGLEGIPYLEKVLKNTIKLHQPSL
jgi:hypothetical protein